MLTLQSSHKVIIHSNPTNLIFKEIVLSLFFNLFFKQQKNLIFAIGAHFCALRSSLILIHNQSSLSIN